MPRRIGTPHTPYADLAAHLTALRKRARLSQRALAATAAVSRGTVQNAESGTSAPSPAVLDALLDACRAPDHARHDAHKLRNRGRTAARGRRFHAPSAQLIHGRGALADVLADAYEKAGAPSPTSFTRPTAGLTPVPRTTLYNIVNRRRLPATEEQLETFLSVCHVRRSERAYIHNAWRHLRNFPQPKPPTHRAHPHGATDEAALRSAAQRRLRRTLADRAPGLGAPGHRQLLSVLPDAIADEVIEIGLHHVTALYAARNGTTITTSPSERILLLLQSQHTSALDARETRRAALSSSDDADNRRRHNDWYARQDQEQEAQHLRHLLTSNTPP
ncbi:helix-turn-helix domain-containing protein [Streptomyces sp. NBC_00882]|uniref:helix-turn-helix domain-containing protein n=1 Tax=Streptomyces TaxID=1883 RepID=UPI00386489DE|nr:helix-turn-helix domain-containing protein [Streptomyces sp. NBC_00882]WSZ63781.1 helix-turn-helix domain-containing protein [Streptomyces canus]